MAALISIVYKHLVGILTNYESYLVLEEYQSISATSQWYYVKGYMTLFYFVSHSVMTPNAPRCPPRSAHEEIMENEQTRYGHVVDVLSFCQNIMQITREGIGTEMFERGGDEVVTLTRSILIEA